MRRDGLRHVGVGAEMTGVAAFDPGPKASTGMFSRVWSVPLKVGSLPWSAVRMTRSPGLSIAISSRQAAVEILQAGGVAGDVAAVPVELVEVDEVGEDEIAVLRLGKRLQRAIELGLVVRRLQHSGDAAAGEDVGDLADGKNLASARLGEVEQGLARAAGWQNPCGCRCA